MLDIIKNSLIKCLMLTIISFSVISCLSTAKLSDFPKTSDAIDFKKYSNEYVTQPSPFWTKQTSNEYYFEKKINIPEINIVEVFSSAFSGSGYSINAVDTLNNYLIGKRGLRSNEWNSITGLYYKYITNESKLVVYINTRITQDITGGWTENRSKEIGQIIENKLDGK